MIPNAVLQGWGSSKVLECMHNNQDLGPQSDFGVIDCRHMEFSDSCSIIPLWLGRAVGITGHRSPIDTIEEIWFKTLQFLKHNQFA